MKVYVKFCKANIHGGLGAKLSNFHAPVPTGGNLSLNAKGVDSCFRRNDKFADLYTNRKLNSPDKKPSIKLSCPINNKLTKNNKAVVVVGSPPEIEEILPQGEWNTKIYAGYRKGANCASAPWQELPNGKRILCHIPVNELRSMQKVQRDPSADGGTQ